MRSTRRTSATTLPHPYLCACDARSCADPTPDLPHADNDIGDEGGKELAAALRVNTTLTTIHLGGAIRLPRIGSHAAAFPPRVLQACLRC